MTVLHVLASLPVVFTDLLACVPVTRVDLPGSDPDTFNPSVVVLCLTFEGFFGTSPQYFCD